MISNEDKTAIKQVIQSTVTDQYEAAYVAGIGAHIGLGEKKARLLARAAGCAAIKYFGEDIKADHATFAAVCQAEYEKTLLELGSHIESVPQGLILPAHMSNGNVIVN